MLLSAKRKLDGGANRQLPNGTVSFVDDEWVPRNTLIWIFFAQGVVILPMLLHLPFWIPILWCLSVLWRTQIFRGAWPFPGRMIKIVLGVLCICGILISYSGKIGVEPMVCFLIVSFTLKLVELRERKDVLLVIFIAFIVLAAHFLFSQSIWATGYGILCFLLLISALRSVFRCRHVSVVQELKSGVVLLLQCFPVMVILFLVTPRLGPLWTMPLPNSSSKTGFGDSMEPGDFGRLIQSHDPAFRVTFENLRDDQPVDSTMSLSTFPDPKDRYWRGLVFDFFDGRKWRRARQSWMERYAVKPSSLAQENWQLNIGSDATPIQYSVLLEPHYQPWLFTLMAPIYVSARGMDAGFVNDFLLANKTPVVSRTQYRVRSVLDYSSIQADLSQRDFYKNIQLPDLGNPRARSLARSWKASGKNTREIIQAALAEYQRDFTYTLEPPLLGSDSVDEFLFITKKGFCEHFSSSFVFLLRSAGIPSRVVVGYQGGEVNPLENYMLVRQSDAHAWAEVWIAGEGWVRVDPTAAVAPSRIERGLADSLSESEAKKVRGDVFGLSNMSIFRNLKLGMELLAYRWHRTVLGYDEKLQFNLLNKLLGGAEAWRIGLFFLLTIATFLLCYYLAMVIWTGKIEQPPEVRLYLRFLKKLQKKGCRMHGGESPTRLSKRIALEFPDWHPQVSRIVKLYNHIAYAGGEEHIPRLKKAVERFN